MDFWKPLLGFLATEATAPEAYGLYHIVWLALIAGLTVFAVLQGRKHSAETVNRVVFLTAVVVFALEIYKQFVFTFGDGSGEASYSWYAFPFQFCSTPMYAGLLLGIFRKGRVRQMLQSYLSCYALFAGLAVMLYPNDVYIATVGINIQTMVCHGSMVVIGGYLLGSGQVKLEWKTLLKAMPVFAVCVAIAATLNELAYRVGILQEHTFNMFFISPYLECTLPVYSLVHNAVPFPVNLILYILGFTAAAGLILLLCKGLQLLSRPLQQRIGRPATT